MERKTKHRILGILVIVALAIILFPFIQSNKDKVETSTITAPPFPEQTAAANKSDELKPTATDTPLQPEALVQNENRTITPIAEMDTVKQTPDDTIQTPVDTSPSIAPAVPGIANPGAAEPPKQLDKTPDTSAAPSTINSSSVMKEEKKSPAVKPVEPLPTHKKPSKLAAKNNTNSKKIAAIKKLNHKDVISPFDNNGLAKLDESAWVIQLGSFKNKANALRLVNQLRASGYKAFMQQVSLSAGDHTTRVFVGPEEKQGNARNLAVKLESSLHIKGIVISYKPFMI